MRLYQRYLIQKKRHDELEKAAMEEYKQRLDSAKTSISKVHVSAADALANCL